ncbi:MAG: phosphopyruvate hydratase [Candidatus Staskawiczbacteria bacterium RIFCSPHIGHO2_02_FULL_42_22]|uniref:Enolase n=1 Tax=Candidatus Staskawiczbacteria bacterium RIFCSPHIGHO2_02_FULL_42_22 TaxID=1802207 RepID=A0A1G2I6J2_9BACT|nr:MAG: phosphopyruvate hydratase [Candidatus Staskawiczbacteria bacterium RIFCSPHIGHO2_02_FULL_42_22]
MSIIKEINAHEIRDSRGKPTVEVEIVTGNGSFIASCPSGASTGKNEALELRDADGIGVLTAIKNVNEIIAPKLKGKNPENQKELDELMIALDGTPNKSKLGANAILPISMAICRAGAASKKIPLYQHISEIGNWKLVIGNFKMPLPGFNFLEGGRHAEGRNKLEMQEFMVIPQKKSFRENLILGSQIFEKFKENIIKNYGADVPMSDEGAFAPQTSKVEPILFMLKSAIGPSEAGIALDCAASEFYNNGKYVLEGKEFSRQELLEFYKDLIDRFPIISIEDPFSEDDWTGFEELKKALPGTIIIGDDLTTTNIAKIKEAESKKACNGIIIKLNQIGTVSETIEAVKLAQSYGWKIMVSHRSGETMDNFIADLAVGVGADFIKSGAYTKDERKVKYDRLLEIENELSKNK